MFKKDKTFILNKKNNHSKVEVEIGDIKQKEDFYPQAKLKYWDNECNFSIRYNEDIEDSEYGLDGSTVRWRTGDKKKEVKLYELEGYEDGGLEIEVIFNEKPSSNVIEYSIQTKEFNFIYQPGLTKEEIDRGCIRPDNVIGSYSVRHKTKKDNFEDKDGNPVGNQYKTGKAFHIFRPEAIDNVGNKVWCNLNIDEKNDLLTVTIPQDYLDNASYPVIVDPTLGYTSIGASDTTLAGNNSMSVKVQSTATDTISKMSFYNYTDSTANFKAVIFNYESPWTTFYIIDNGVSPGFEYAGSGDAWYDATYSIAPALTNNSYYFVGVVVDVSSANVKYDSGSLGDSLYWYTNYANPVDLTSDHLDSYHYSTYATYGVGTGPELHYRKSDTTTDITLYDSDSTSSVTWNQIMNLQAGGDTWLAQLDSNLSHTYATDLRVRVDDITYTVLSQEGTPTPPAGDAWAEAFIVIDTGSETNKSHTTEADRALTGTTVEQGDWSGEWSSPDLTLPADGFYMFGYCDFLRQSGTVRSGSICQMEYSGGKLGILGASSYGYNRFAGGSDYSSRHMVGTKSDALEDFVLTVREGTQLGISPRIGDYDRTSGDPRGMWVLNIKEIGDFLVSTTSGITNYAAQYGSTPRPIDLGTPSAYTSGSTLPVEFDTTDDSSGTAITRTDEVFTIAANKIVLSTITYQHYTNNGRDCLMVRLDRDDSPEVYSSCFNRNSGVTQLVSSITYPIITGGSSEDIDFKVIDQVEGSSNKSITEASVAFIDVTGQDVCILTKTDSDITSIISTDQGTGITFPVADEIQVDSSFDHPSGNTSRITNDSGGTITVLCGFNVFADRDAITSGNRKSPMSQILHNGTALDYTIASEYSRGQESAEDTFVAGYSYCAPVVMADNDYLEMDLFDLTYATNEDMIVNCSDEKAIYFWAIRIDNS